MIPPSDLSALSRTRKLSLLVAALVFIAGAFWLAAQLIAAPQASLAFVDAYGILFLVALAGAWLVTEYLRKRRRRS